MTWAGNLLLSFHFTLRVAINSEQIFYYSLVYTQETKPLNLTYLAGLRQAACLQALADILIDS